MANTVLILGGHGRFGRNAAQAFAAAGWQVRQFDRSRDTLTEAIEGMDVVVNGWNPPDYTTWAQDLLPLHRSVIDALKGSDVPVIVPGNVYVFGPQTPAPWSETSPHAATNPLGRLRIEMEAEYRASGVRTILLRGGDFLDTEASGNWFDLIMVKGLGRGVLTYPGRRDIPHVWAYLPDIARAAVMLAERREALPVFADIPFPGYCVSGADLAGALQAGLGRPVRAKRMSWLPLILASPFMANLRYLREMRYLWETPHRLDATLFHTLLPEFRETPLEQALVSATAHLAEAPAGVPQQA